MIASPKEIISEFKQIKQILIMNINNRTLFRELLQLLISIERAKAFLKKCLRCPLPPIVKVPLN